MTPLRGIHAWVWNRSDGAPAEVVREAADLGLDGLFVRAWNGQRAVDPRGFDFNRQYREYLDLAANLTADHLQITPWTYVYGPAEGNRPRREAESFASAVLDTKPPAAIIDIEHEGVSREYGGRPGPTTTLFDAARDAFGDTPLVFSTYDLPEFHDVSRRADGMAYGVMGDRSIRGIPQVYWARRAVKGAAAVDRSASQWRAFTPGLGIAPAVQCHTTITHAQLRHAWGRITEGNLSNVRPGMSLWRWGVMNDACRAFLRSVRDREAPSDAPTPDEITRDRAARFMNLGHWWGEYLRATPGSKGKRITTPGGRDLSWEEIRDLIVNQQQHVD